MVGEVAQVVERPLDMWEVPGSIPRFSTFKFLFLIVCNRMSPSKVVCKFPWLLLEIQLFYSFFFQFLVSRVVFVFL